MDPPSDYPTRLNAAPIRVRQKGTARRGRPLAGARKRARRLAWAQVRGSGGGGVSSFGGSQRRCRQPPPPPPPPPPLPPPLPLPLPPPLPPTVRGESQSPLGHPVERVGSRSRSVRVRAPVRSRTRAWAFLPLLFDTSDGEKRWIAR